MSTTNALIQTARSGMPGFQGRLTAPEDPGYDEARKVYNAMIDRRPALIASCADSSDVAKVISFAGDHDLLLAVRGGAHNGAGLGTCEDGVVLDLSGLKGVAVDPGARTARVGGGCTWGEVDAATNEHGLATPSGIVSTTGVGGLTLGGGLGHLTRKCGLTIDNLLEAEVVLASGETVRAAADENPDLFWAIRGGGGNFGVVTSFLFRLHEVGTVVAGPTFWPVELGAEVLRRLPRLSRPAPRASSNGFFAFASVYRARRRRLPGGAASAQGLRGRLVLCRRPRGRRRGDGPVAGRVAGAVAARATADAPAAFQGAFDPVYPAGDQWYWRADFVKEIPDAAVEAHAKFGAEMPTWQSTMHLYPIDGAAHDVGPSDTPWSYRDAVWGSVFAGVDHDPANAEVIRRWCVDYFEALHPYSAGGAYVNMMMDEGQERVRASYRDNYDRLARIKGTYDPDNLFRVNQNIQPQA